MKKILVATIIAMSVAFSPFTIYANSVPCEVRNAEYYNEPQIIRCTCYTADEGAITKSGQAVREGIVAGKEEWLGYVASVYEVNEDGSLGDWIGYFEFLDTGAGIDTDGDGIGDSIKNGTSIDIYRNSMDEAKEWISNYGDYVYIQVIHGKG